MFNLIDKYRLQIGIGLVIVILTATGILISQNRKTSQQVKTSEKSTTMTTSSSLPAISSAANSPSTAKKTTKETGAVAGAATQAPTSRVPIAGKINLNTASLAELDTLSGIGKVKAQAIIDYREANGPFQTVDQLVKVKGIGPKTLEKLRDKITVE